MAVTSGPISRQMWIGLSSDPKPSGAEFAAQFYEYDTGKTYIWTGSPDHQGQQATPPQPPQWVEYMPAYPWALDPTQQNLY